ncbi:MAG: ArnT family glycosyltransferase [Candidatus Electrothrix sp. YB6]
MMHCCRTKEPGEEANAISPAWLIIALGLAVRLLISDRFLLAPDEAHYWQWSRYPDIGYYDHPPMIAWCIWLTTHVFGHTEFAVRLPTILGNTITSVYLCLLAARWFSRQTILQVALLSQGVLLLNGAALIATPDGLLLPCWAGACYHAAVALERDTLRQWLLTGIWFGLGLLSKYTMLLFLPSLFFCMLFTGAYRQRLLTVKPWSGLLTGLVLFTPVVLWNARNNWVTFRHVLFQGGVDNAALITPAYLGEFFGTQAALLSPLIFLFILVAWFRGRAGQRIAQEQAAFLIWMSLTGFAVFALLSLHVRIYGNWPAPAYLTALILTAALYSPGRAGTPASRYRLWNIGIGLAFLLSILVTAQLLYPVLPLRADLDRTAQETKGWDTLARILDNELQQMERPDKTFIFGLRYQFAGELAFYMQGQPRTVSINRWSRPNVYDFWFEDAILIGKDAVGVFEHKPVITVLPEVFERVDPVREITLRRTTPWFGEETVHTLYMARCYGFKGGLRWLPKDPDDVRAIR